MLTPVDLLVADGGPVTRTPVDDARPAIDQALVEERFECDTNGTDVPGVEREPRARPVARVPKPPHLLVDAAAVLLVPGVDPRLECGAAECLLGRPLVSKLPLDNVLRCDRGVIGARAPLDLEPRHPSLAYQRVLNGETAGVPHVQGTRDVWWRERDDVCGSRAGITGVPNAELFPALPPAQLHARGIERCVHGASRPMSIWPGDGSGCECG